MKNPQKAGRLRRLPPGGVRREKHMSYKLEGFMKYKKIFMIILAAVLVLPLMLAACNNSNSTYEQTEDNSISAAMQGNVSITTPEVGSLTKDDYLELYYDIITEWEAAYIRHVNYDYIYKDTFSFWLYQGYTNLLEAHYALYDIDGNGTYELLLKKHHNYDDIIAYIFTIKDGVPVNLFGYNDEGLLREVPWSRHGGGKVLNNGMIDCDWGNYTIYKIAEDGYSLVEIASAMPYDYLTQSQLAEAKWKFYINEIEVDYDYYVQCLAEQGYAANHKNDLADIDWIIVDYVNINLG